jgi:alpha-beta hydrolase superfamily lysophospholipase
METNIELVTITDNILEGYRHTERKNQRAALFVHGFTGKSHTAWEAAGNACKDTKKTFFRLIAYDPDLADYDVFTFSYRTTFLRGSPIENLAKQLRAQIDVLLSESRRVGRDYHLVAIAHSMGGLVCMQYIIDCLQDHEPPPLLGVILYGTPTTGTEVVKIAKLMFSVMGLSTPILGWGLSLLSKTQRQIEDLGTASDFLKRLHDQWSLRVVNGGHTSVDKSGRMWLPVRVVTGEDDWVVSEASGKGVYGAIDWHTLPYQHVALVKPSSVTDERYRPAKTFLQAYRQGQRPEVLSRIWEISQSIWQTHSCKMIRDLKFNANIHFCSEQPVDRVLIEGGFSPCRVRCQYRTVLEISSIRVAVSFGPVGSIRIWEAKPEPAYVHQLLVDTIPQEDRNRVTKSIYQILDQRDPAKAWNTLFAQLAVSINEIPLTPGEIAPPPNTASGPPVPSQGWLSRSYVLPPEKHELVGEEVALDLVYESVVPNALSSFRFFFKWLTQACRCSLTVHDDLDYFVTSQNFAQGQKVEVVEEPPSIDRHSVLVTSEDVLLPGSSVQIRWQRKAQMDSEKTEQPKSGGRFSQPERS